MTQALSLEQLRLLRTRSQCLDPARAFAASEAVALVQELLGVQAQELPAAGLALRARSRDLTAEMVRRLREEERTLVLTWSMRGTLHLVSAADLPWMLSLFGPLFIRLDERRFKQLDLDPDTRRRARDAIREILLKMGPLTRPHLASELALRSIPVEGQAIAHLVRYAALEGDICFGPEAAGGLTYVLIEEWLPSLKEYEADPSVPELARRYLSAYGPASPADLAKWSGISLVEARAGFEAISANIIEMSDNGTPLWLPAERANWPAASPDEPVVRLLPRYDAYLLGYQNRDFCVPKRFARRIHPGGGIIHSTLVVSGQAAGVWSSLKKKGRTIVQVEPFEPLPTDALPGLQAEVADLGRYLGVETTLDLKIPS